MIENTNTKQFYLGPILNNTLEITDFLFNDAEQIKIKHSKLNEEGILIDVDLNYSTDYEVTKVLSSDINAAEAALTASTGQITLKNVNVLAGEKLTVYRVSQIIQDKNYPRTGAFPAATHEGALDYLTMQNQEQREEITRSLKVPISTPNFNAAVPVPLPNRILRINNDAAGFEFVPYDLDDRLDTFENATEETIAVNQAKVEADFNMFKAETNTTLDKFKSEINTDVANIQTEVDSANSKADSAITTAASANNKADSAVNTANTAIDTANSALGIVNISNTTANNANSTADNANSTANNALTVANNASTVANSAKETADETSNKVDRFETNISSVILAAEKINELEGAVEEAKTAADTANAAAENATKAADNAVAALGSKQDVISDLEIIRQGASKGETALQSVPSEYVTETELNAKGYLTSYTETDPIYTADKPNIAKTDLSNLTEEGLKFIKDNSGSGLEVCDIGMALYVDETKGLRRYLNGQSVDINTNTQAFLNRLLEIKNTNPDYFTTEDNWQAEALLNIDGCVYKFVLNYASDGETVVSVRLPKYPDYVEINAGGTLPVVGNGMTLGLTNGSNKVGIFYYSYLQARDALYGSTTGTQYSGSEPTYGKSFGVTTDAKKSGIQTTLKQTKLKLRYFIQIATGSETENNIINEIELNNPYSLFDSKYSDHELNNLSWLKSEGQWNAKAVYPTAYDKLLKVYNGTETVEGLSVKLSTESYTDYDFVLNTSDETFRLPLKNHTADDECTALILYYYVGETVQNANLIDAGRIGEQMLTRGNKQEIMRWGIPDITKQIRTTSRTITLEQDSYCSFYGQISAYSIGAVYVNGKEVMSMTNPTNSAVYIGGASFVASKDDVITFGSGYTSQTLTTNIMPLKGVNND